MKLLPDSKTNFLIDFHEINQFNLSRNSFCLTVLKGFLLWILVPDRVRPCASYTHRKTTRSYFYPWISGCGLTFRKSFPLPLSPAEKRVPALFDKVKLFSAGSVPSVISLRCRNKRQWVPRVRPESIRCEVAKSPETACGELTDGIARNGREFNFNTKHIEAKVISPLWS